MKYKILIFLLSLFALNSCTGEQKDPKLEQAAALHNEAVEREQLARKKLDSLQSHKQQLVADSTALLEKQQGFIRSLDQLNLDIDNWSNNLIEVPGFEHHHHHGHDHSHDHDHHHDHGKKQPEVTPEHMLNIQREFRDSIMAIQQRADKLLREIPK